MLQYVICEIGGKQYKFVPGKPLEIDFQAGSEKDIEANVLLISDKGLKIGKPYLKEKITIKYLENVKGDKIRVSKYHAKANYRKVTGIRPKFTRVILDVKNTS